MAAPIASQVLGEVLPYLEITKDNQEEEEKQEVVVPNLIGKTIDEAKKGLEKLKLNILKLVKFIEEIIGLEGL